MTNITLSTPEFYKAGSAGVSAVVGYESHTNRVARYSFTAPEGGASALRLAFSGNSRGNGAFPSLGFFVGTDPDSHRDAGMGSPCTGTLNALEDYVSYSGSAQLVLLPNTTYYVWLFPTTETFGWMHWSRNQGAAIVSLSGAATSALTASDGVLGEELTFSVERYAHTTHTLRCSFGARTETVCLQTDAETITWTPPLELAQQCPNALSAPAVYTLETFSGGVSIGSRTVTRLLTVPESCVPGLRFRWVDTAAHRSFYDALVQKVSALEVTVEAEGIYGSTVRSTAVLVDGKPYSGGVLEGSGQVKLTVNATDSRGRTASVTEMLTVQGYSHPKATLTAIRVDAEGNLDDMGEFARLTVSCTGTPLDTGKLPMLGVGLLGEEPVMEEFTGSAYTVTVAAPSTESPTFRALYMDALMTPARAEAQLSIGYATLDVLSGGKGIAFGTTATREGFHCAMPAYFTGGVEGADRWQEDGGLYRMAGSEREWLTPPLKPGTEYRTARRLNGAPVYVKRIAHTFTEDSCPATGMQMFTLTGVLPALVDVEQLTAGVYFSGGFYGALPYITGGGGLIAACKVRSNGNVELHYLNAKNSPGDRALITVYYTKEEV